MANLTENLKDSMTATFPREFDIPNAMTIQEIYDKLNARAAAFQMPFSVKGGIPGERVVFEKEPNLDVIIWLHVKNGTHIKITPVTQDSSATAPDTIITTLHTGGMNFCTFLPTPQAALPSRPFTALPTADTAAPAACNTMCASFFTSFAAVASVFLAIPPAMCKNFLMVSPPSFYTSR